MYIYLNLLTEMHCSRQSFAYAVVTTLLLFMLMLTVLFMLLLIVLSV